jgi:hypothetical protein
MDTRAFSPEITSAMRNLRGSALLTRGHINLMSLEAVALRLADRWERRRDAVYAYAVKTLERHLGEAIYYLRVSETDFLVIQQAGGKYAAQLACLRCLGEVFTYFLGAADPADLVIREVTRLTDQGLEAVRVDHDALAVAAEREQEAVAASPAAADTTESWSPLITSNGRRLRVSCALEPVIELKGFAKIGNRITRRVLSVGTEESLGAADLQALSGRDIEKIDIATIARGLDRLRSEEGEGRLLSVIMPVSFTSLSSQQGRSAVAAMLQSAKSYVRTGVICEVCDIKDVPQTALLAATSLIGPACLLLTGGLGVVPPRPPANLRSAGLHALSFEAPQGLVGDAEFHRWATAALNASKPIAKSVMLYRLNSQRHVAIAALLGASHASLRAAAPARPAQVADDRRMADATL